MQSMNNPALVSEDHAPPAPVASPRPLDIWMALACYVVTFEIEPRLEEAGIAAIGLAAVNHGLVHAIVILVSWGIRLGLIVLAVRLTQLAVSDHLGWVRPHMGAVALAIVLVGLYYLAFALLLIGAGVAGASIADYRTAVAAGTSPWWFVLQYWPAIFLASFVEESFFRGLLWRSVQFRLGNAAAFAVTTLLFAGVHYNYWMPGGELNPGVLVVQYLVPSAIFGALRWYSGGTTVTILAHALDNATLRIVPIVLSALLP